MPNIAVVGAQWGDEGKGKIVDRLSERFDVVVVVSVDEHCSIVDVGKLESHVSLSRLGAMLPRVGLLGVVERETLRSMPRCVG